METMETFVSMREFSVSTHQFQFLSGVVFVLGSMPSFLFPCVALLFPCASSLGKTLEGIWAVTVAVIVGP